ncbi:unnamed protein product [Sphagnum balticum]
MGGALRGHPLLSVKAEALAAARHGSPQDSDDDHHHQTDEQLHFLDRQKALEAAMSDVNGSFGKGIVTRLGSAGGALVWIFGPKSSGKTTLTLHTIAEIQTYIENAVEDLEAEQGGNAMLVDAQHCFDPYYSKALGVNVESLIITVLTPTSVLLLTDALHWYSVVQLTVMYGNPEVMSGGLALKLLASLHLEIRNTGKIRSVSSSVSS